MNTQSEPADRLTHEPASHHGAHQTTAPVHDAAWYADHLRADVERFAVALETGPLDAPVAACGDWDLARLAGHLGGIHRWARFCAEHGRAPTADETAAFGRLDPADPAGWLRAGGAALADTLLAIDPEAPTWHPFPVARVGAVWPRRQAHETSIHRWDAQRAVGVPEPIDPELASDGIDEYFTVAIPRLMVREHVALPSGSFHVHCTDVAGEWIAWAEGAEGADPADLAGYRVERTHRRADAVLRGPAEAVLLRLWGRASQRAGELEQIGDEAALAAWLSIAGM